MRRALIPLLAVLASPVSAGADWLHTSGGVRIGSPERDTDSIAFVFGDTTLRLANPNVPWGVELGVYGYANTIGSPHETYGTLTWDVPGLRIAAGVPRAAYDSFAVSAFDRTFVTFGADQARLTRSSATWGPMFDGHLPYGLRIEGQHDALRFAASLHHAEIGDLTTASAGVAYTLGAINLSAAIEGSFGTDDTISAKLQAVWSKGAVEAGLGLYAPGTAGLEEMAEVFATVSATDQFSVTGILQTPFDGGDMSAGILGRYALDDGLDISVGALTAGGDDPVYNASIGLNF